MESSLHDQDYNLWLEQTAIALRNQDIERMDWENLVAEIEDIGASQKRALALRSYMYRLIEHIFKLQYIDSDFLPYLVRGICAAIDSNCSSDYDGY